MTLLFFLFKKIQLTFCLEPTPATRHSGRAGPRMNLHPYKAYLNLVGHCAMYMLPVSALPSRMVSSGSIGIRPLLRNPASLAGSRCRTTAVVRRHMSAQDGRQEQSQGLGRKLEIKVASPEEMEATGAFFGADSQSGDVVLLWGCVRRRTSYCCLQSCTQQDLLNLYLYLGLHFASYVWTRRIVVLYCIPGTLVLCRDLYYPPGFCFAGTWARARLASRGGLFEQELEILTLL